MYTCRAGLTIINKRVLGAWHNSCLYKRHWRSTTADVIIINIILIATPLERTCNIHRHSEFVWPSIIFCFDHPVLFSFYYSGIVDIYSYTWLLPKTSCRVVVEGASRPHIISLLFSLGGLCLVKAAHAAHVLVGWAEQWVSNVDHLIGFYIHTPCNAWVCRKQCSQPVLTGDIVSEWVYEAVNVAITDYLLHWVT